MPSIRKVLCNPLIGVLCCGLSLLLVPETVCAQPSDHAATPSATPDTGGDAADGSSPVTDAERIAGLQKLLAADQKWQAKLDEQLTQLDEQFAQASHEFTQLDMQLTSAQADLKAAASEQQRSERQRRLESLEGQWRKVRDHFDRIIERRQAVQQQLATLAEKIALEERFLERLKSGAPPETLLTPSEAAPDVTAREAESAENGPTSAPVIPGFPLPSTAEPTPAEETAPAASPQSGEPPMVEPAEVDDRVLTARRELKEKQAVLEVARQRVNQLDESIAVFKRDLAGAERLLATAQGEVASTVEAVRALEAQLEEQRAAEAAEDELETLRTELEEAQNELEQAREEVTQHTARVSESHTILNRLSTTREAAVEQVEQAANDVEAAERRLRFLGSPFAPHRILRWLTSVGPRILVVLLVMIFLWWLSRVMARRIFSAVVQRSQRGTAAAREQRAETLRRVFQNAADLAIIALGTLSILDMSGIQVTVLLGGAAVIGAAVAFGSQNLIKDYFSGFMILVENQYSVGNVIRIAETAGSVEDITLRMTVLRDEEGVVHFIPHGQVTKVSNMTHGWSRAVFNIGIGYREDIERVMEVLLTLARELRSDPEFGPSILEEPEMLGVDAFGDSSVIIKLLVKTRPLKQWSVKRELFRRIKRRFDELGIELPLPHRVIHHDWPQASRRSALTNHDRQPDES